MRGYEGNCWEARTTAPVHPHSVLVSFCGSGRTRFFQASRSCVLFPTMRSFGCGCCCGRRFACRNRPPLRTCDLGSTDTCAQVLAGAARASGHRVRQVMDFDMCWSAWRSCGTPCRGWSVPCFGCYFLGSEIDGCANCPTAQMLNTFTDGCVDVDPLSCDHAFHGSFARQTACWSEAPPPECQWQRCCP